MHRALAQTYIDEARVVSAVEVVEYASLVEERELGHILNLLELGRVHLLHIVLVHRRLLTVVQLHGNLLSFLAHDAGLEKAMVLVRYPYQLLLRPLGMGHSVVHFSTVHLKVLQIWIHFSLL